MAIMLNLDLFQNYYNQRCLIKIFSQVVYLIDSILHFIGDQSGVST